MTLEDIIEYFGSGYRFERATGLSHTNLIHWRKRGYIPLVSQRKIEERTEGALKVRLEDLGRS